MNGYIQDRGTKKWTALMLPEHIKELKAWQAEDYYEEKPIFEDWELQLIQEEIEVGFNAENIIALKMWQAGKISTLQGVIVNLGSGCIVLKTPYGTETIAVDGIICIQNIV